LTAYGIELSPEQVYCSALHPTTTVYPGFASNVRSATKAAGASYKTVPIDWTNIFPEIKKGYPVIFDINDERSTFKARPHDSRQHFVTVIGYTDDGKFIIVNDPAGYLGRHAPNMVLNKEWFDQAVKRYNNRKLHVIMPKGETK